MGKISKCIIFVRVSTDRQATDEQTVRLRSLATADGFSAENQLIIDYHESGIRLKEEERLGLTEMKVLIESNPEITTVYAFEISRIARTKKVLFSIEEFLVERKIQLIIAEPSLRLLNDDGSINDAAEFAFTMFAQFAESEMRLKKERFKNGAARAKKMGHWHGGRVLFGFKVEDKKLVPDEQNSFIVRRMFEMYVQGHPQEYIAKYLNEFGLKTKGYNIHKLLNNPKYIEYHDKEWCRLNLDDKYLYEMLILESFQAGLSWECVLNKRDDFTKAFDNVKRTVWLGYELIQPIEEKVIDNNK